MRRRPDVISKETQEDSLNGVAKEVQVLFYKDLTRNPTILFKGSWLGKDINILLNVIVRGFGQYKKALRQKERING